MKTCTKCGEEKTLAGFSRDRCAADGYQYRCRDCQRAHNAKPHIRKTRQALAKKYRQLPRAREAARQRCREYRQTPKGRARELLISAKHRAKQLGVACNLDAAWFDKRLSSGRCEITGVEFDLRAGAGKQPFAPSIDRIKPGGGYTKANCRVVCWVLNAAMGNWGLEPVLEIASVLLERDRG